MRIYCLTCREYILKTSPSFKIGGPYSGDMFGQATECRWHSDYFNFARWVTDGNLFCPRCTGAFILGNELLTEHGIVKPGQKSIDTSFSVVHSEGEFAGQLMSASTYSREVENHRVAPVRTLPENSTPPEPAETRLEVMQRLREGGMSYAKIGEEVGISGTRVSVLLKKAEK